MRIVKDTPFEFGFLYWQLRPPEGVMMVLVKGTFDLVHDGVCTPSAEQSLTTGPLHWDDDPNCSLRLDGDFALRKPRGEVHFVGHAHAPGAAPTGSLLAGLRAGSVSCNMAVFGDRTFDAAGAVTAPTPFTKIPVRWERAFGGAGFARNPVGRGIDAVDTEQGRRVALPNFEDHATPITAPGDRPAPACFAPVPPTWPERTRRAGTYDARYMKTRWPWLPDDFDFGYYNSAPAAQQIDGYWRGDEALGLQHLTPSRAVLRTRLPGLRARCFAEVRRAHGVDFVEVPLRLDTLTLDGDRERCECVWRGHLAGVTEALEEVETLFFVHEPLEAEHELAHYQAWLARKRAEAEAEDAGFEPEAPPEDAPPAPAPPTPTPQELFASLAKSMQLEGPAPGVDAATHAAMVAQVAALAVAPDPPPMPKPSEVRAGMAAGGVEIPDELRDLPDEEEAPPEEAPEETPGLTREDVLRHRAYELPLTGADLTGVDLSEIDLSGQDFSDAILTGANLQGCVLREAVFRGAAMAGADMTEADLSAAVFDGADLTDVTAVRVNAEGASFVEATAENSRWTGSRLFRATLEDGEFTGAQMAACDLRESRCDRADFTDAVLERAHFDGASLASACLDGARCAAAVFDDATLTDLRADEGADLTGASLRRAKADDAHFVAAAMEGAQLGEASLERAEFAKARLARADLTNAVLRGARFHEADLTGARLLRVDAMEASFEAATLLEADLRGANLTGAQLWRARTERAQLELALLHRTALDPENQA